MKTGNDKEEMDNGLTGYKVSAPSDEFAQWVLEESHLGGHDLRTRTEDFAVEVIEFFRMLPPTEEARVIGRQFLRSGTSIGAQYCEGYRSRSTAEYVSKIGGALQEAEETGYWFRVSRRAGILESTTLDPIEAEVGELTAIFTTAIASARRREDSR